MIWFRLLPFWCCIHISIKAPAQDFTLERLPQSLINSEYDEITPVPSRDGKTLFFTRVGHPAFTRTLLIDSIDVSLQFAEYQYTNTLSRMYTQMTGSTVSNPTRTSFNQDTWIASGDSAGVFSKVIHPGYPINNALANSLVAITPDPNIFYVINHYERNGDMDRGFSYIRRVNDTIWSFPEKVTIKDFYTITSDVSLTMSFDGDILIMSATRNDSREMDLYVCHREGEHLWGAPIHLGNIVNSERREIAPFLSEDNMTLFFASNRTGTNGGMDIFMTKRLDDSWKNWTTPERLIEPINSVYDDSQPYFNMSSGYLYFASKRSGGNSDIYRVQIAPPQPTEIIVIGRVFNKKTGKIVPKSRVRYGIPGRYSNTIDAPDGQFTLAIPKGVKFILKPEKPSFIGLTDSIFFRRDYYYFKEHYYDLYLDVMEEGEKIELEPIYFQQSKAVILESSYPELERLASVLDENPGLYIRIEGHTDNIGKAEDLQKLSEDRAWAIKQFLMDRGGIAPVRIDVKGWGAKKPINDNSTDDQRQLNRRVEIIITKL